MISGRIGWFPLGPREPYLPPYASSHAYIQKVNIPHVRVDGGQKIDPSKLRYAHRDQPHAYTVVAQQSFSHSHQVGDVRIEVPDSELKKTRVSGSLAPVAPERESVLVTTRGEGKGPRPPAKTGQQKVVVKKVPPEPRTPFSAQQEELVKNPGRPVEPKQKTPRDENAAATSPWVKQKPQASDQDLKPAQPQKKPQKQPQAQQQVPQKQAQEQAPQKQAPQATTKPSQGQKDPKVQQGSKKENTQPAPQKRKKVLKRKLVNGKWVWVEEWETVEE